MTEVDLASYRAWVGRTETRRETLTDTLIEKARATLSSCLPERALALPVGIHWCLAPTVVPHAAIGPDGHPDGGDFLPPIPLPSRQWAGGEVSFLQPLALGDVVTRTSTVVDLTSKKGKSGPLVFVTVEHSYRIGSCRAILERQTLVYRNRPTPQTQEDAGGSQVSNACAGTPDSQTRLSFSPRNDVLADGIMVIDRVMLFRYSALTFNAHRIHYDRDYARHQEGYADLVVHGPLQATILMNHAVAHSTEPLTHFSCRATSPLLVNRPFRVESSVAAAGRLSCIDCMSGKVTMEARFTPAGSIN